MKLFLILFFLCITPLLAQFGGNQSIKLKDFTVSGQDEQQQRWVLSGQQTRSNGPMVDIEHFILQLLLKQKSGKSTRDFLETDPEGDIHVTLKSIQCSMNTMTREIKSASPVSITIGNTISITGIGYDVDLPQKVILLRSTVSIHMKLKSNPLNIKKITK